MASISPTQSNIQAALAAFLAEIMPGVSSPAVFVGSISGTTLTVSPLPNMAPVGILGTIEANNPLMGLGVAPGTVITEQLTGSPAGGVGTYEVSISQQVDSLPMSTGVTIVAGQQNRVAEPANPYFCIITPIMFKRMMTNVDISEDCKFTASISGTTMTVDEVESGVIAAGNVVYGTGVSLGTIIVGQLTSDTWQVAPSQTVTERTLSAGTKTMQQGAIVTVQVDFHAVDTLGGDFAQIFSTTLRDDFGVSFFAGLEAPLNGIAPIDADDPKQTPFISAENRYEQRWSVDCQLDVQQFTSVPQTYADATSLTVNDVTALFPPS